MPPLTATPTNTRPCRTRGSLRGAAAGDSVALPDDGDRGRAAGLAAGDAPPGRLPAPARCAGGSTEIPAQPAASAAEVTIPASNDRFTCSQSPDWVDVPDFPPR